MSRVRAVACTCGRESDRVTDEQRRANGWRLLPAQTELGEVFVWVCPEDVETRKRVLRAS